MYNIYLKMNKILVCPHYNAQAVSAVYGNNPSLFEKYHGNQKKIRMDKRSVFKC
jgi:carbonic anhydrase